MDPSENPDRRSDPPPPLWPRAGGSSVPGESSSGDEGPIGEPSAGVPQDGSDESSGAARTHPDRPSHPHGLPDGRSDPDGVSPTRPVEPPADVDPGAGTSTDDRDDTRHGSGSGAAAFFRELPILILVAFLLAFLLRTFVLQVFFIPSSSMEPTLQIDDRMVVEKITLRLRDIRRGDVVVFESEDEPLTEPLSGGDRFVRAVGQFLGVVPTSARDFVKRVIGVGGDEIVIEEGQVFVNDVALDEPYVVFGDQESYGPVTVPEGELFFLGDNRPNSSDSRRSLGLVPEDLVVGRAVMIIWPLDNWDSLTGVHHDLGSTDDGEANSSTDLVGVARG